MNRNFWYREAVPYWIICVNVCSVHWNFRYETNAPKVPKIKVHRNICEITVYPAAPFCICHKHQAIPRVPSKKATPVGSSLVK